MSKCLQCDGAGVVRLFGGLQMVICGCMIQTVRQNFAKEAPTTMPEKLPGIKNEEDDREALCGCRYVDPPSRRGDAGDGLILCAWHLRHLG